MKIPPISIEDVWYRSGFSIKNYFYRLCSLLDYRWYLHEFPAHVRSDRNIDPIKNFVCFRITLNYGKQSVSISTVSNPTQHSVKSGAVDYDTKENQLDV